MDSKKLAKEAQLAQYGESKAKTAVQSKDPKCNVRESRGGWGSSHHGLAVVSTDEPLSPRMYGQRRDLTWINKKRD